jgi:outer membrane lipoprotein SlyB
MEWSADLERRGARWSAASRIYAKPATSVALFATSHRQIVCARTPTREFNPIRLSHLSGGTMKPSMLVVLTIAGSALLGGCASGDSRDDRYDNANYRYEGTRSSESDYGYVDSIESTRSGSNSNAVAGTIIGGVIGGVLGHQIGGGSGNTIATVAGAVGGAVVGHEIGRINADGDAYRLRIRYDNASYQTVTVAGIGDLRVGDRVRIENGRAYRH